MFEKIKTIFVDQLQVNAEITEESELSDLGINSLELADLVMHCEDEFGIQIDDDELRKFITVGDIVKFVEKKTSEN